MIVAKNLQDEDDAIDPSFTFRRFFFFAVSDSWPLSVFESLSESSSLELEDDELELLELSDAIPVLSSRFTWMAIFASSGSFTWKKCSKLASQLVSLSRFSQVSLNHCSTTRKILREANTWEKLNENLSSGNVT